MTYTVIMEPADDRAYGAYVPDLSGCVSSGNTPGQTLDSIREAIQGHIETLRELGEPIPPPRSFASVVSCYMTETTVASNAFIGHHQELGSSSN